MTQHTPVRGSSETSNSAVREKELVSVAKLGSYKSRAAGSLFCLQEGKQSLPIVMLTEKTTDTLPST